MLSLVRQFDVNKRWWSLRELLSDQSNKSCCRDEIAFMHQVILRSPFIAGLSMTDSEDIFQMPGATSLLPGKRRHEIVGRFYIGNVVNKMRIKGWVSRELTSVKSPITFYVLQLPRFLNIMKDTPSQFGTTGKLSSRKHVTWSECPATALCWKT